MRGGLEPPRGMAGTRLEPRAIDSWRLGHRWPILDVRFLNYIYSLSPYNFYF